MGPIARCVAETWTPPFDAPLPDDRASYVQRAKIGSIALRKWRRGLNLFLKGQGGLRRDRVTDSDLRLLWIHKGTPQVGDSLMDLAARVLLRDRVERVDLLTDVHLTALYRHDQVFTHVASCAADLPRDYDLVLLHSVSSRAIQEKVLAFKSVPFVHMHGYYTGPEFNRTLFDFYRLAQLLGQEALFPDIPAMARTVMWCGTEDEAAVDALSLPAGAVVVALGGVRGWRTYNRWDEVIGLMKTASEGGCPPIVLVGSANGSDQRDQLVAAHPDVRFVDRLERHSLTEVFALMKRCSQVLAADGGLLHVAQSAGVPVVALFADIIDPAMRVTLANPTVSLHGPRCVDDIAPSEVVEAWKRCRVQFRPPKFDTC